MKLTHRGNILDDANELGENGLSGYVALINGITATDGLESVIRPLLSGLPLKLGQGPFRARCEGNFLSCGLDDPLIKGIEIARGKFGPGVWGVEGVVDCADEVDRH